MDIRVLRKFNDRIMGGFNPLLKHDLKPRETHLISLIEKEPNRPLHFYAEHVGLEKGSFTYMCETLELKGIINRVFNEKDRRKKSISLTVQGLQIAKEIDLAFQQHLEDTFKIFTPEEMLELKEAIKTINKLNRKLPRPPRKKGR